MKYSDNYEFSLPYKADNDPADIDILSENFELIDAILKNHEGFLGNNAKVLDKNEVTLETSPSDIPLGVSVCFVDTGKFVDGIYEMGVLKSYNSGDENQLYQITQVWYGFDRPMQRKSYKQIESTSTTHIWEDWFEYAVVSDIEQEVNSALSQAKESGEFDGDDGLSAYEIWLSQGNTGTEADFLESLEGDAYTLTEADKDEIAETVKNEVPLVKTAEQPTFANSIDEMTDTSKIYVMPDGFLYAYMSVIVPSVPLYTNLAVNFQEGYRFNSSGVAVETAGATVCEDYIGTLTSGDIIRIKGFGAGQDYNSQWSNASKTNTNAAKLNSTANFYSYSYDSSTETITIQVTSDNASYRYFRISGVLTGTTDDVIITLNEEIKESAPTTGYRWTNTGLAFVPADYENIIIGIQEDVDEMKEDILNLQNGNNSSGGTSSNTVTIPTYWESMVAEKTELVKSLQATGGKDCVCFVWGADTHIPDNDGGRTTDIGKVMAKMLDNCEIPFAVLSGDINTRASCSTEEKLLNAQKQMPIHLSPLWGTNRLLMALGNHDGCWGDSTGYYKHQFSPEELWQVFFRGQALDFRRVFSDDGLYFYVDNVAQKTRFIILNSQFGGEYAEDSNGWAVNDRFSNSCYGQEQLDWLANIALDLPIGYGAIIISHVPPNIAYTVDKEQLIGIVNAFNGKTNYSGSYDGVDGWTSSNVSVDFTDAKGEIIAMFTGHVHGDSVDTTTMNCPILTILSAGAKANEHNGFVEPEGGRTAGTDTETSFDVVTINKQTRTIDCIRVGAGIDREVNY